MDWFSGIVVFILTWWICIFLVLPFGLKRDEKGMPNDPHLKKKLLIITGVSIVIWLLIYLLIDSDIISFREMAKSLALQDEIL
ncbi:MAG: DUF1467 family protein [Alphaproteobacteria bacterium]|nr:DUF1467 family protein [Alphaproteobacteria bacterium]